MLFTYFLFVCLFLFVTSAFAEGVLLRQRLNVDFNVVFTVFNGCISLFYIPSHILKLTRNKTLFCM